MNKKAKNTVLKGILAKKAMDTDGDTKNPFAKFKAMKAKK